MSGWKEAGNCLVQVASGCERGIRGIVRDYGGGHGRRCEGAAAVRHREEVAGGPPRRVLRRSQPRRQRRQRQRAAGAQLHGDSRRARLPRRARPRGLLAPRAHPAHRRGGEVARRGHRGGGGQRVLGGGVHGGRRAHGHRQLQPVLLRARTSQRGGRDGGASGEPEGEADGCGGGGAQERVRRAGSNREAVGDTCLANQEQQKQ